MSVVTIIASQTFNWPVDQFIMQHAKLKNSFFHLRHTTSDMCVKVCDSACSRCKHAALVIYIVSSAVKFSLKFFNRSSVSLTDVRLSL